MRRAPSGYAGRVHVNGRPLVVMLLVAACGGPSSKPAPAGETAPSDAGVADAAVSDGVSQEHSPGTWCADRAEDFCDDFDTPAFTSRWWSMNLTSGASGGGLPGGALDRTNHTSVPNAFTAKTAAIAGTGAEIFQIQSGRSGNTDASHLDADFAFAVRVEAVGAGPRTEIARIEGVNPITFASYAVALLLSPSGASVELTQGSQGSVVKALAASPGARAWSRVTIHLALERTVYGPPTPVVVQIDTAPPETFSIDRGMGVNPFLRLGLAVTGPSAPSEVAYDDVTYDTQP